ncbi:hypothetical protein CEUSTIGMA_g6652.t1 [Chlamydomonas eustigma]|uniref:von Hippel-Lindau disease tumour suppressor beta domain-containing protein n=1 Tax=Chlamydomonas eustigma TaxID=1157962 RepID=A0A250X8J6_9CHLO|nr:hypothetical protein CEUSTIGMA_g6652.t1 [Chlamydomonas eustigma]|eukprot:GAX79212.1 hypothetical protein CEUSTIGMA_g6652.t1 [Chlamydomonas eustigma]
MKATHTCTIEASKEAIISARRSLLCLIMSISHPSNRSGPLQPSAPLSLLKRSSHKHISEYRGQKSVATFHIFVNLTEEPAELYWFHDGGQVKHGSIQPGSNLYIGTYTFHQWKVQDLTGRLLGVYAGDSATITILTNGCCIQRNSSLPELEKELETGGNGTFRKRGSVLGFPIWAYDCVCQEAVERMQHITARMLENSPPEVVKNMRDAEAALGIIGKDQGLTDLPPHQFMRFMEGRDLNATSRGLGGTLSIPLTSVGEENLTMKDDRMYPCQSIYVHELGHAVLNLGLIPEHHRALCEAYEAAVHAKLYPDSIYMMSNEQEYFATGAEAWFASTIRTDVNGGMNTREKLKEHDPALAHLLLQAFGDGSWRYVHDCPHKLRMPTKEDREYRKKPNASLTGRDTGFEEPQRAPSLKNASSFVKPLLDKDRDDSAHATSSKLAPHPEASTAQLTLKEGKEPSVGTGSEATPLYRSGSEATPLYRSPCVAEDHNASERPACTSSDVSAERGSQKSQAAGGQLVGSYKRGSCWEAVLSLPYPSTVSPGQHSRSAKRIAKSEAVERSSVAPQEEEGGERGNAAGAQPEYSCQVGLCSCCCCFGAVGPVPAPSAAPTMTASPKSTWPSVNGGCSPSSAFMSYWIGGVWGACCLCGNRRKGGDKET